MIDETYELTIQGSHCGSPFSMSLAYKQIQTVADPGFQLATNWMSLVAGYPWAEIFETLSDKLRIQCLAWSSPTDVGAVLIENAVGTDTHPAMPPVVAVMMNIRPESPWPGPNPSKPKYDIGRFFVPGLVVQDADQFMLLETNFGPWFSFGNACLEIDVASTPTFRLKPFPDFIEPAGSPAGSEDTAGSCTPDPLVRRIKTRRPNACELFASVGQTGGRPVFDPTA